MLKALAWYVLGNIDSPDSSTRPQIEDSGPWLRGYLRIVRPSMTSYKKILVKKVEPTYFFLFEGLDT